MSTPDGGHAPSVLTTARRLESQMDGTRSSAPVVDVSDASRVLECSWAERQLRFQHLVRHYLSQILHGCKSSSCSTPTCLSCQRRVASRPVRPPTQLTARALAHYLASLDDPQRGLCPHELKVLPMSLGINGTAITVQADNTTQHETSHSQGLQAAIKKRRQARKDARSFSQNLYDSFTVICAYSKQLPSPSSLLQTLRPPNSSPLPSTAAPHNVDEEAITTIPANEEMITSHTTESVRIAPTSPKILDSGHQVHRIPFNPPKLRSTRSVDQALSKGTEDSPKLSIAKTGKKSFTLGRSVSTTPSTLPSVSPENTQSAPESTARISPVLPVLSLLTCKTLEELKDDIDNQHNHRRRNNVGRHVISGANRRSQLSASFADRSLFYNLSDPETLLQSFREANSAFEKSPLSHLDSAHLTQSFRDWHQRNGSVVFDSLWIALGALFKPPPQLQSQRSPCPTPPRRRASRDSSTEHPDEQIYKSVSHRYVSNNEAAHIIMICIHALTSSVSIGLPSMWAQLRKLRAWGVIVPDSISPPEGFDEGDFTRQKMCIVDELEYEPALRLAERLLSAVGARTCFEHILANMKKHEHQDEPVDGTSNPTVMDLIVQHLIVVEHVSLGSKQRMAPDVSTNDDPGWTVTATLVEWLKTIITKRWDNKPIVNKWSSVGASVMLLDKLSISRNSLNLCGEMLQMPFINERLDTTEEPMKYISWKAQPNIFHILEYPILIPTEHLINYFRTINFTSMMTQYDLTTRTHQMQRSLDVLLRVPHWQMIRSRMGVTISDCLVLDVSREDPLKDTLDRLWGLEKRMLLKPLKVKMGQLEGEVGADHGGVSYEFFRVVLSEAFKPEHGMFTLDPQTRMTWFQPNTLEPDWKFEMIGMLFSLAIYNGITLPVTFPLVLYRFLLQAEPPSRSKRNKEEMDLLEDGWPDLFQGFEQLLAWDAGDVGDVFMREYTFSYQAFGQRIDHNMEEAYIRPKHATPNSPAVRPEDLLRVENKDGKLVTNENREEFVSDYIYHLTYLSVSPQLHAFQKGFLSCLQSKSLRFFTAQTLRGLVEGEQHISIPELCRCARYEDGYSATHPTIQNFWAIVEKYNQDDCRHLLEFVTASDRVPVTGYKSITFHVVRVGDVQMLPTSSTCFGKLYLPDYKDKETMKTKLELAIQNSKGFGVV